MEIEKEQESNLILFWLHRIRPEVWTVFFSTLICGVLCHGTMLFNKLSPRDDLAYLFQPGATVTSGRWMLHVLAWLESLFYGSINTSLPLFNGMLSILCIALVGCLLVNLLKIRNRVSCALLGGLLVSFPFVTALFAYMFTSLYYMSGLLMMVLCVWLICRKTPWWVKFAAVLLGGASLGIYQAFLSFLVSMILLYDIAALADGKNRISDVLKQMALQAVCAAGVLAVYFAANRFFLMKFDVTLTEYQGIDQMGALPIATYLERCGKAYREFVNPTRGSYQEMYPGTLHAVYQFIIAGEALLAFRLVFLTWQKSRGKALLLAALLALMPLACNLIYVMGELVHGVMIYGHVMHFMLLIWLLDRAEFGRARIRQGVPVFASLVLMITCLMFARYDHQCYLKVTFNQQEAISYCTSMITRIQSVKGYRPDMELVLIGTQKADDPTFYQMKELDFIQLIAYHTTSSDYFYDVYKETMRTWCGFSPSWYDGDEIQELPEVQAMPAYPADGSIQIVQDVIVVKLY